MRRLLLSILVLALLAPAGAASADRTFRLWGGGWGHGIGMSQYGAYGLAQRGWGAARIVRFYYSGAAVETREAPAPAFRVGLLQRRERVTLEAAKGGFDLVLASGSVVESVPAGETRIVDVQDGAYRIRKPSGEVVGGQKWGGAADHLTARRADGSVIDVEQWKHALGRGSLELNILGDGTMHAIAVLDPEEYLFGLGEVPASWPQAAQRAQAIAARTYAYRKVADNPNQMRPICNCGLLSDVRDQNYTGWDKETGAGAANWIAAVQGTAKRVATFKGQLIATYYSSSSGGYTEGVEYWGGQPQPYLRGKCDPGDYVGANPNRVWQTELTGSSIAEKLKELHGSLSVVTGIGVVTRGVSGRVVEAKIRGRDAAGGPVEVLAGGDELRRLLGLRSTRFWVNRNLTVVDEIRQRYDRMRCRPGLPRSPQRRAAGGRWQAFEKGRLYFKPRAGAHWIHGPVLGRYLKAGGPGGRLGFPTSDLRSTKKQVRARFERGTIACSRSSGKCTLRG